MARSFVNDTFTLFAESSVFTVAPVVSTDSAAYATGATVTVTYAGLPGNYKAVHTFRDEAIRHWRAALRRRSQKTRITWARMGRLARRWIPATKIVHPYPEQRFAASHPW